MKVRENFLRLTTKTYPYKTEDQLEPLLPKGMQRDAHGNRILRIGKSSSMFTAHMDTVGWGGQSDVKHVFDGDFVGTDGRTILGADDKAGVVIMMHMIEQKVPGLYYMFVGEESGCQGSRPVAATFNGKEEGILRVVSFDRRGYGSVITHQCGSRCCSEEFADALGEMFNKVGDFAVPWRKDPGGIFTDSQKFVTKVQECTNLSVGYFNEHSSTERQNLSYLESVAAAAAKIDWEKLPAVREAKEETYNYHSYGGGGGGGVSAGAGYGGRGYWDEYDDYYVTPRVNVTPTTPTTHDTEYTRRRSNKGWTWWYD